MDLGLNLTLVSYYQSDLKYRDLMRAAQWYDSPYNYWIPAKEGYCRTGNYILTAGGKGTLQVTDDSGAVKNCVFDNDDAQYTLLCNDSFKRWLIRRTVNDGTTPIHDVQLYPSDMPGTSIFHPQYIADLTGFHTLRSLHFYNIEQSSEVEWSDSKPERWADFVEICNRTGSHPWINIPHQATADYCAHLGTVFQNLSGSLKPRIEYSNEIWNYLYPFGAQTNWVAAKAAIDGITYRQEYAKLANAAYTAFEASFGREAVWVYAGQSGNAATITTSLDYADAQGYRYDAIASAPYCLLTPNWTDILAAYSGGDMAGAVAILMGNLRDGLNTYVIPRSRTWKTIADARGVPNLAYEWAANFDFGATDAAKIAVGEAAAGSKDMYEFVKEMKAVLDPYFTEGNYYDHSTKWAAGKSWGAKQYLDQTAWKWTALRELLDGVAPANSTVVTLADAVVTTLNMATLSQSFTAERCFVPVTEIRDLVDLRVLVVPTSKTDTVLSRAPNVGLEYVIDVGIQKVIGHGTMTNAEINTATDPLVALAEEIAALFEGQSLADGLARCTNVKHTMIYSPDHLDTKRVFFSVLSLTFKRFR